MTHNWKIYNLDRNILDGNVYGVLYACESDFNNHRTRHIDYVTLSTGSSSEPGFIPFEDLTESGIKEWFINTLSTSSIETQNSSSISLQIIESNNITTQRGTPW
jgi:hypothetical protein